VKNELQVSLGSPRETSLTRTVRSFMTALRLYANHMLVPHQTCTHNHIHAHARTHAPGLHAKVSMADPSVFMLREEGKATVYLLLYVEDTLIYSVNMTHVQEVKSLLGSHVKVKDLGEAGTFLGMHILEVEDESGVLTSVKLSNKKLANWFLGGCLQSSWFLLLTWQMPR
jgi:Reverse transcriptase (RNA-dependent DNA polymerase)